MSEIKCLCGDEKPLFVLLSKTKNKELENFFIQFCEFSRERYDYIVTNHYSSYPKGGSAKAISQDLLNSLQDKKLSKYFKQ